MATRRNVTAPNLPVSPPDYSQPWHEQYANVNRLFFNTVSNAINAPLPYGAYYDTTDHTAAATNTAYPVTLNSIQTEYSVKRGSNLSRIYVAETGVYNYQFSVQLNATGGANHHVYLWPRINGVDVPNSAGKIVVGANSETVSAWNYFFTLRDGDYVELFWSTDNTNAYLDYIAAASPVPAIPSVIVTICWVSNIAI
jgi:hypothetical protein